MEKVKDFHMRYPNKPKAISLWDSSLKGEVMSQTPPSSIACIITYTNIVAYIIIYIIVNS